jgi:hypothetical protein
MEVRDNIMTILKSITPIRYKFSKEYKQLDKAFKSMSLQNLMKSLDYHPKLKDEFAPSPEFLNNKNKYEINFKNSNEYIKELSDLNNLPLIANNKNCLKNGQFNDEYDINSLNNKEEKKKIMEEKERRKRERLEERLRRFKLWKESDSNTDSLKYNPNYDFIKKKVFSVHIRPPTVKKVRIPKAENEKNDDKKKKNLAANNTLNNTQNQNITQSQNLNQNQTQIAITFDKNKNDPNNNINITMNNIRNPNLKESGNNNNSLTLNDSGSNRSSSSKLRYKELKNNFSTKSISRNVSKNKEKMQNLKNRLKVFHKNSSTNSDINTIEINKSTNIEDLSLIHQDREKYSSIHSMRNINSNKNIYLPKIVKKIKKPLKSRTKRNNGIKHSIYFKKMLGRKDDLFGEQAKNVIAYCPNYDFFRPHIPTTTFKYKKNDEDYKKYVTGKIIRGYKYSPEKYFVFEYKKNKPKKLNLIRERLKMIEILKKKVE